MSGKIKSLGLIFSLCCWPVFEAMTAKQFAEAYERAKENFLRLCSDEGYDPNESHDWYTYQQQRGWDNDRNGYDETTLWTLLQDKTMRLLRLKYPAICKADEERIERREDAKVDKDGWAFSPYQISVWNARVGTDMILREKHPEMFLPPYVKARVMKG
jgi:hypothetical protein